MKYIEKYLIKYAVLITNYYRIDSSFTSTNNSEKTSVWHIGLSCYKFYCDSPLT